MKCRMVSLIALTACTLLAMSASVDAACTASERAQIEQRLVGRWKYYLKGDEMCYGMIFAAKGAFTEFQKGCTGSRDETNHGRW